jgi:hypothetical protein
MVILKKPNATFDVDIGLMVFPFKHTIEPQHPCSKIPLAVYRDGQLKHTEWTQFKS